MVQKATDDRYFINLAVPPTVNHSSVLTSILEKNKKRLQTQLIVVAYTDKGDLILTIIQYSGTEYLVIRDATCGKLGVGGGKDFKYSKWMMFTRGD